MLHLKNLLKTSACVLMVAFITAVPGTAAAEGLRLNLIATIDNGPALEKVKWEIFRNGTERVKSAQKHSTHVNIPAGKYTIVARLTTANDKTVVRKRNFIHRNNNTLVVVAMDP